MSHYSNVSTFSLHKETRNKRKHNYVQIPKIRITTKPLSYRIVELTAP